MLLRDIPNRTLPLRSYRVVATTIKTVAEQLRKELAEKGETFPASLEEALEALEKENQAAATLLSSDVSLPELDRDTDHIIAALRWLFIYWSQLLTATDYKSLPESLAKRLAQLQTVLATFFPEGTGYLKEDTKIQWTHLDDLKRAMLSPTGSAILAELGMKEEGLWICEWIDLYGSRAGVTDVTVAKKIAQLQERKESFGVAFDDVKVQVFAAFKDSKNPAHLARRASLIRPFLEEVERLRDIERKSREAKAEKESKKAEKENSLQEG